MGDGEGHLVDPPRIVQLEQERRELAALLGALPEQRDGQIVAKPRRRQCESILGRLVEGGVGLHHADHRCVGRLHRRIVRPAAEQEHEEWGTCGHLDLPLTAPSYAMWPDHPVTSLGPLRRSRPWM